VRSDERQRILLEASAWQEVRVKARGRASRISLDDEFCVWSGDGWRITVSRSARTVRFATTDYHSGPLTLTKRELHELAKVVNGRVGGFRRRS
jgi:hypothetical protein